MTQTTSDAVGVFACPRCGTALHNGTLACPACGGLVYAQRLTELATEAQREEAQHPIRAAMIWRQCLPLLPLDSQQYQMISQRIGMLASGMGAIPQAGIDGQPAPAVRRNDPWPLAIAKTVGSMLISILVYSAVFGSEDYVEGLKFATGFVLLILVHELGHVIAMWRYGLKASAPIFIPFLGALINLRERPRNALQEAVVGIGGPVFGAIASAACFAYFLKTGDKMVLTLAYVGFWLNLFNLLPVPPLDGGRVTAAVSPWVWLPGLGLVVWRVVHDYVVHRRTDFIMILLLVYAWPRVRQTLFARERDSEYYKIGKLASWGMGAAYLALGAALAVLFFKAGAMGPALKIDL